jgi:hypothetical protein
MTFHCIMYCSGINVSTPWSRLPTLPVLLAGGYDTTDNPVLYIYNNNKKHHWYPKKKKKTTQNKNPPAHPGATTVLWTTICLF